MLMSSSCGQPDLMNSPERPAVAITTTPLPSTPLPTQRPAATAALRTTRKPTGTGPPTATPALPSPTPTLEPTPLGHFLTPRSGAQVQLSIEFFRNGKSYNVYVGEGSSIGAANTSGYNGENALFRWSGDIDKDGESEYLVTLQSCGAYCIEDVRLYDYDSVKDGYFVADSVGAKWPTLAEIEDFDHDGNPELVLSNYGFCHKCATGTRVLSALAIVRFDSGKFRDVTLEYPDKIRTDASAKLAAAATPGESDYGHEILLAGFLYDKFQLGEIRDGRATFDRVCATVIAPEARSPFDCAKYRMEVESAIAAFAALP